jgi:hypothetical protein
LLELLDNQRFARSVRPNPEQLAAIMVRRLKRELPPRWDGTPRYPERIIEPLEVPYADAERAAHRALVRYTELRTRTAQDDAERFASEFVMKLLKKRLFSSPEAFRLTLEKHLESLRSARRSTGHKQQPVVGILRRQVEALDEDAADDSELDFATDEVVDSAVALFSPLTDEEEQLLAEMRSWATDASMRPDAKAAEMISWLKSTLFSDGGWNSERVIIFTEYRATQKWLQGVLAFNGFTGEDRVMTMYGGMHSDDRERVKAAFQTSPDKSPVRILLATDSASEGTRTGAYKAAVRLDANDRSPKPGRHCGRCAYLGMCPVVPV